MATPYQLPLASLLSILAFAVLLFLMTRKNKR
jgi:ABC-type enterochelin transport system permease subunit